MSDYQIGLMGIVVLLVLLLLRIPVAFAMFLVGFAGIVVLNGTPAAMSLLASESFTLASSPELVVIPLFILMGNIASATGLSRQLYNAAYALVGNLRGGLASATIVGCGGFAALSGSSVASALTMGKVALSEMVKPAEKIDSIRVNHVSGLGTGSGEGGSTAGSDAGSPVNTAVKAIMDMAVGLPTLNKLGEQISAGLGSTDKDDAGKG